MARKKAASTRTEGWWGNMIVFGPFLYDYITLSIFESVDSVDSAGGMNNLMEATESSPRRTISVALAVSQASHLLSRLVTPVPLTQLPQRKPAAQGGGERGHQPQSRMSSN